MLLQVSNGLQNIKNIPEKNTCGFRNETATIRLQCAIYMQTVYFCEGLSYPSLYPATLYVKVEFHRFRYYKLHQDNIMY